MHIGGPFENAQGGIVSTLMIINVANAAEASTFIDNEPFHKAKGVHNDSLRISAVPQLSLKVSIFRIVC